MTLCSGQFFLKRFGEQFNKTLNGFIAAAMAVMES
jgi:hypothetical protein